MDYIIPAFSMLFIDSVYLSNIGGPMFDKMVKKIVGDDKNTRFQEFIKLKTYMMTFDNTENWKSKILQKFI